MKLRDGMRVRGRINGRKITNGTLTYEDGRWYFCQDVEDGVSCRNKRGFKYSWVFDINKDGSFSNGVDLMPFQSTDIRDLYVGARIKHPDGGIREVLGICWRVIFTSFTDNFNIVCDSYHTIEELIDKGYTLIPEEPVEEKKTINIEGKEFTVEQLREMVKKAEGV